MANVRTDCNAYLLVGAETVPRLITRGKPLEVDAPGSRRFPSLDAAEGPACSASRGRLRWFLSWRSRVRLESAFLR